MSSQRQRDKRIHKLAIEFLLSLKKHGKSLVTKELLWEYFAPTRPNTIPEIYERILESAQNANMKSGVIGGSIDGVFNLKKVLCDFRPKAILVKYQDDSEQVFKDIKRTLKPRGEVNPGPSGLWPKYCRTILASAKFMVQFASAEDFYSWVDFFYKEDRTRPALPLLLSNEIYGFGLALACDFLKELGYVKFAKPDVYLRTIFTALDLCSEKVTDYELLSAIVRVAENSGITPYAADKAFWLIGSGKFYRHGIKTGRNSDNFIAYVREHQ